MLVFGNAARREPVARKLARLRAQLAAARAAPAGIARHGLLVDALIEAGELAQGIADARFTAAGRRDARWPDSAAAMALTMAIARLCARSWQSGFAQGPDDAEAEEEVLLAASAAALPSIDIEVKQPEGFAFYALYPEAFLAAAAPLRHRPWRVIGLRSIGTTLAAMVATALGDDAPLTLRPIGHPFDRRVAWDGGTLAMAGAHHAVVDEGPGLSGSSVAGVVRQLRAEGVPPDRIHLFPGHGNGPGAQAGAETRTLWASAPMHLADFDELILRAAEPAHRLQTWVEAVVGQLASPLDEITGGGWRAAHRVAPAAQMPAHPWQERRKFLARGSDGRTWLVKFAGLGHAARQRFACAGQLAAAGFSPAVAGLCHGFLVERWHADMAPLAPDRLGDAALRVRLIERLAHYIAFRARSFAAPDECGASLQALHEAARHNGLEVLGNQGAAAWDRHGRAAALLQARVRPVRTDNRMHAWEWLADGDRLLKTDAVDHHAGHDLVGCQDPAWDVTGAVAEFGLGSAECRRLVEGLARRGCEIDADLLRFCAPAYLGFQLGHFHLAAQDAAAGLERTCLAQHADRYAQMLQRLLADS
jgi:hypothetical protein